MGDYLYVIAHYPLYVGHFLISVWLFLCSLPWPAKGEWFGSLSIFLGLYPVRVLMAALLPEKKVARRMYKKRKSVPTKDDHQAASAASGFIHHF